MHTILDKVMTFAYCGWLPYIVCVITCQFEVGVREGNSNNSDRSLLGRCRQDVYIEREPNCFQVGYV